MAEQRSTPTNLTEIIARPSAAPINLSATWVDPLSLVLMDLRRVERLEVYIIHCIMLLMFVSSAQHAL